MGSVELAVRRDGSFERLFALKRLNAAFAGESDVRAMFLDEARIAGLLRHPNVVSVVSVGEDAAGPFLVMEYVDGVSVGELIQNRAVHPIPLDLGLRIVAQAADGLHAAHELVGPDGSALDIVHRDVSPQNILLGFDGIARVTDFGIAKALGRVTRTSTGILKGKLGYISPEQLRFEEPDRRADLFALGVVLFELLTGKRLYPSKGDMDGPRRILNEAPPDLGDHRRDADPELVELCFELLAKDREERPKTAKELARRLDAMIAALVAQGGATDTSEFLQRHFASQRASRAEAVSSALRGLALGVSVGKPRSAGFFAPSTPPVEPPPPPPPAKRSRVVLAAAFAASALALGLGWFAFTRTVATPVAPEPAATPASVPASLSTRAPASEPSVADPPRAASSPPPPRATVPALTRATNAKPAPAKPRTCDPPYEVDSSGVKTYKRECFK
jgi:serine/threonine-protein kinase